MVVVVVFVVVRFCCVVFCCSGGSSSAGSRRRPRRHSRRSCPISNLVIESLRQNHGTCDSPNRSQTLQPQMSTYAGTSRNRGVCCSLPCVLPPKLLPKPKEFQPI